VGDVSARRAELVRGEVITGLTRYGIAVACVATTVGIALWLRPVVLAAGQLSLVAILITGWLCGLRPALLAWGLATLAFAYFFTPPLDSLETDLAEVPRLAIFVLLGPLHGDHERRATPGRGFAAADPPGAGGASSRAHRGSGAEQRAPARGGTRGLPGRGRTARARVDPREHRPYRPGHSDHE
jgi:hypothetical protein